MHTLVSSLGHTAHSGYGKIYAHSVYPVIAYILSSFSRLIPFAIGDLFIALSIAGVLLYPAYARRFQKKNGNVSC